MKKRSLLTALFGMLLSTSAYSTTFTVNSTDDEPDSSVSGSGTSTSCDVTGGSGTPVCTLRAAVQEANAHDGADTIEFDSTVFPTGTSTTITLNEALVVSSLCRMDQEDSAKTGDLDINDDLTITGNGFITITNTSDVSETPCASGTLRKDRFFDIQGTTAITVNISGLALTGGSLTNSSTGGGAIYISNTNATVNLSDLDISTNTTDGQGGAILSNADSLTLTNSTFDTNTSKKSGGAVYHSGSGDLTISGSIFNSNSISATTSAGGGAIYTSSSLYVSNTTFTGNTNMRSSVNNEGGAIYFANSGTMEIKDAYFESNGATSQGGAIYVATGSTISITGTGPVGDSNYASQGGFIYLSGSSVLSIDGGSDGLGLKNNNAVTFSTELGNGGAIYLGKKSSLTLINAILSTNTADADGGTVYMEDDNTVTFDTVSAFDNSSDEFGGVVYTNNAFVFDINDSSFDRNVAVQGGAIYAKNDAVATIKNTSFSTNGDSTATTDGGAIYSNFASLTLSGSSFSDNKSVNRGGAIFAENASLVNLSDSSSFTSNVSTDGASIHTIDSDLNVNSVQFSGDIASNSGGGVFATGSTSNIMISESSFQNEGSFSQGGAISASVDTLEITSTSFDICYGLSGGAVFTDSSTAKLSNVMFGSNSATSGGAIYHKAGSLTIANESSFSANSAISEAGAIYSTDDLKIQDSTFSGNLCTSGSGGAISTSKSLSLDNVQISGSKSSAGNGGGILFTGDTLSLSETSITSNKSINGGGVYAVIPSGTVSTITVTQSLIAGNDTLSGGSGGAGFYLDNATFVMSNSTISSNGENTVDGAGIYAKDSQLKITNSTIYKNLVTSTGHGAGIYLSGATVVSVKNTIIAGNSRASDAGFDCSIDLSSGSRIDSLGNNFIPETATSGCEYDEISGSDISNTEEPNLEDLADNGGATLTHAVPSTSLVLDNGDCVTDAILIDQRGFTRSTPCEIGAVDFDQTWYADADADGFGDVASSLDRPTQPDGYISVSDITVDFDCDDTDSAVNSGATEVCDGVDNNCDTQTDENATDEICDGFDNDCDTEIDEDDVCGTTTGETTGGTTGETTGETTGGTTGGTTGSEPVDADGDGFTSDVDCDDTNDSINPDAVDDTEDGIDQDCSEADFSESKISGSGSSGCSLVVD